MDGFRAFKFWVAINKHFKEKKFNLFENRGRIRGSFKTFLARNDYELINRLADRFTEKEFVFYVASNLIYGNKDALWNYQDGIVNYNLFRDRRESIVSVVLKDLKIIDSQAIKLNDGIGLLRLLTRGDITVETVIAINKIFNFTDFVRQTGYGAHLEPLLLRIDKANRFVKIPQRMEKDILEKIISDNHQNT